MSGVAKGQQGILGRNERQAVLSRCFLVPILNAISLAMTSSQGRIAETLETFYSAADKSSEGAMAGHAYKRSVDDLDSSFMRELVCRPLIPR